MKVSFTHIEVDITTIIMNPHVLAIALLNHGISITIVKARVKNHFSSGPYFPSTNDLWFMNVLWKLLIFNLLIQSHVNVNKLFSVSSVSGQIGFFEDVII